MLKLLIYFLKNNMQKVDFPEPKTELQQKREFQIFLKIWENKTIKKRVIWYLDSDYNGVIKIREENGKISWIKNYINIDSNVIK